MLLYLCKREFFSWNVVQEIRDFVICEAWCPFPAENREGNHVL